jgi:DGQHR domain-containing protein
MNVVELPALALSQGPGRTIFAFGIDGKLVSQFATVSRAGRGDDGHLFGYQRPEVRKHIAEIKGYLESEAPMVPNALVFAFDARVTFQATAGGSGPSRPGLLRIPVTEEGEAPVAFIVDGQQRVAAIRDARVEAFPMFAIGFIAASDAEAREQFILVNSSKPLPRSLIHELLPAVDARMPTHFEGRKLPTQLVQLLNHHEDSPLHKAIATATNPGARIRDNSLIKFLENSLTDGVLYRIRMVEGQGMLPLMQQVLFDYWRAVQATWPELWSLPPKRSRLLHGAGVVTLGFLMDAIADRRRDGPWPSQAHFETHLAALKPYCRWNEGYWDFGPDLRRRWDELQNTSHDIQLLANHLLRLYMNLAPEIR